MSDHGFESPLARLARMRRTAVALRRPGAALIARVRGEPESP